MRSATITGGSTTATGPVENVIEREPSQAAVFPGDAFIVVDFGSPVPVRVVAALFTNAREWRVRAADDEMDLQSSPGYDSGQVPVDGPGLRHRLRLRHDWLSIDEEYRFWRVDFYDPDNPDGRAIVGNLVIDEGFQPRVNISYGAGVGLVDPSRKQRAVGGRIEPLRRLPYIVTEFSLNYGSEDEMYGEALAIDDICGTTEPVLLIRDPDATTHRQWKAVFGLFRPLQPVIEARFSIFQKRFGIEELSA